MTPGAIANLRFRLGTAKNGGEPSAHLAATVAADPIHEFLAARSYSLLAKTINTLNFVAGHSEAG